MKKRGGSISRKEREMNDTENVIGAFGGINAKLMNSDHEFEVNQSVQFCFSAAAFSRMNLCREEVERFN